MWFKKHAKKEIPEGEKPAEPKREKTKEKEKDGTAPPGIKSFWISEKATDLQERGKYVFAVEKNAPKPEVKKAVERRFGVTVKNVAMIMRRGKRKRFKGGWGKMPALKKAVVTLKEGDKIEVL